jgi:hypothetical protein
MALPVTSGLAVDLTAKSLSSIPNGGTVSPWPDISGNGNDGIVYMTGPTMVTGATPNGSPTLRFNNNAITLTNQNIYSGQSSGEVFIVVANPTTNKQPGLYQFGGGDYTYYPWVDGVTIVDGSFTNSQYSFPAVTPASFHVYNVYHDGTNRVTSIDGTVVHSVATAFVNPASSHQHVLGIGTIGTVAWAGDIAEFVAYNRSLTTAERTSVLSYLQGQFMVVDSNVDAPAIGAGVRVPVTAIPDPKLVVPPISVSLSTPAAVILGLLTVPPIGLTVADSGYLAPAPDTVVIPPISARTTMSAALIVQAPPIQLSARASGHVADATIRLIAPADGDTVEIARPQFVVALNSVLLTATWTVQVQYADNDTFTGATTLTQNITAVDGGLWLDPPRDVPATTFWRARILDDVGAAEVDWTDPISFTVDTVLTPVLLDVVWHVDSAASRPIHLWSLDPSTASPGDTVTCYGQGFPAAGQVYFDGNPTSVTRWERKSAVIGSTTDQRHINPDGVEPEHYEADFTVPGYSGPGAIVEVTA